MNDIKLKQVMARFLERHGDDLEIQFLGELMFLAERAAFDRWNEPLTGDYIISTEQGLILRSIYEYAKYGTNIALGAKLFDFSGYGELNQREIDLIDEIYEKYHSWTFVRMRDYMRTLPEYIAPANAFCSVGLEYFLKSIGKTDSQIKEIVNQIKEDKARDKWVEERK